MASPSLTLFVKKRSHIRLHIAEIKVREQIITESSEIAEELNLHFSIVGEKLASEIPSSNVEPESCLEVFKTTFSLKDPPVSVVRKLLAKLNERKARLLKMAGNNDNRPIAHSTIHKVD